MTGEDVVAVNGPVFRNFRASTLLTTQAGGGLVFRQSDEGYYAFGVFPDFARIIRVEALKATELNRWPLTATQASPVKIEIRCDEVDCAFYREEELVGRTKDARFSEGRIGLYLSGKGTALFNNLVVETIK